MCWWPCCCHGTIHRIQTNGKIVWNNSDWGAYYPTTAGINHTYLYAAATDGTDIYVIGDQAYDTATSSTYTTKSLDGATGVVNWTAHSGDWPVDVAYISGIGVLVTTVGRYGSNIACHDPTDGSISWSVMKGSYGGGPVYEHPDGLLYGYYTDGTYNASILNSSGGTVYDITLPSFYSTRGRAAVVYSGDIIYQTSSPKLYRVSIDLAANTTTTVWTRANAFHPMLFGSELWVDTLVSPLLGTYRKADLSTGSLSSTVLSNYSSGGFVHAPYATLVAGNSTPAQYGVAKMTDGSMFTPYHNANSGPYIAERFTDPGSGTFVIQKSFKCKGMGGTHVMPFGDDVIVLNTAV